MQVPGNTGYSISDVFSSQLSGLIVDVSLSPRIVHDHHRRHPHVWSLAHFLWEREGRSEARTVLSEAQKEGRKRRETEVGGKGRDLEEDAANLLQRMNEPPPPPPSSTFTLEPPFSYV